MFCFVSLSSTQTLSLDLHTLFLFSLQILILQTLEPKLRAAAEEGEAY